MTLNDRPSWALVAFDTGSYVVLAGTDDVLGMARDSGLPACIVLSGWVDGRTLGWREKQGLWVWEGIRTASKADPFAGAWRRAKVADLLPLAEDGSEVVGAVAAMAPSSEDLEEMEKDVVMWDTLLTESPEDVDLVDNLVCASREAEQGKKLVELFKRIGGQR